jgi:glycosyltransferase involved in cell wall biosynthesis
MTNILKIKPDDKKGANDPLLSILLPTHNRANVLELALKSILFQSFQNFEVLVVGDGCTDNTAEVVQSFNDDRIKWYNLPKAPSFGYANRNIALKEARGKYIGFAAHDDILFHDHFEKSINALEADPSKDITITRPLWVTRDGLIIPVEFNFDTPSILEQFISRTNNAIPAACVVHRRDCFEKYGYWNEQLSTCGDWDMWARIIEGGGGKSFIFISEPTILHFVANWKQGRLGGLYLSEQWIDLYESSDEVPNELLIKIPENTIEQEVVWYQLSKDPVRWASNVRRAVVAVFDLRILNDRIRMQKTFEENTQLHESLDLVLNSYSWKIGRMITRTVGFLFGWIPWLRTLWKTNKKQPR